MQILKAEMVIEMPDSCTRICAICAEKLKLVRSVIDPDGKIFHMFECKCGERTWDD